MAFGKLFSRLATWFFKDMIPGIFNGISDGLGKIFNRGARS